MKFLRHRFVLASFMVCLGLFGRAQDQPRQQHVGRVLDWSYHHVVLSGGLPAADLDGARAEPRILFRLAERNLPPSAAARGMRQVKQAEVRRHRQFLLMARGSLTLRAPPQLLFFTC